MLSPLGIYIDSSSARYRKNLVAALSSVFPHDPIFTHWPSEEFRQDLGLILSDPHRRGRAIDISQVCRIVVDEALEISEVDPQTGCLACSTKEGTAAFRDLCNVIQTIKEYKTLVRKGREGFEDVNITGVNRLRLDAGIVVLGVSTGGPRVVHEILSKLTNTRLCYVLVQHISQGYDEIFVDTLRRVSHLDIRLAEQNTTLRAGRVYFAPKNHQLIFTGDAQQSRCLLLDGKIHPLFNPCVDITMLSAAKNFSNNLVGVVLTGMGNDGSLGVQSIRQAGGVTIAQSRSSATVYGMPGAAVKTGAIDHVFDVAEMIEFLNRFGEVVDVAG